MYNLYNLYIYVCVQKNLNQKNKKYNKMKTKSVLINSKEWQVLPHEFYTLAPVEGMENLKIIPDLPKLERLVGLLKDLSEEFDEFKETCVFGQYTHGGFLPKSIESHYKNVVEIKKTNSDVCNACMVDVPIEFALQHQATVLILPESLNVLPNYTRFRFVGTDMDVHVRQDAVERFRRRFSVLHNTELHYNNLINLCVMVKNGGELFETMLEKNKHLADRWTILDTGSTDGSVAAAHRIMAGIPGMLYEEPFINFRDSRNRCLDLAGTCCKYNLMLDDTYVVEGNLRDFLEKVRGDQFADSFSLEVRSGDVTYQSNRITKAAGGLRYKYLLHEIIQEEDNVNARVPTSVAWIDDIQNDFMTRRTVDRKQYDLECLLQDAEQDPKNPRHLYYIAQTYSILGDWVNAREYFRRRVEHAVQGYDEERYDAQLEMTRIADRELGEEWVCCEQLYMQCVEIDPERPEPFYFIGIHYMESDPGKAYEFLKTAFLIGYPGERRQMSLRPTLSYHFVPLFLMKLSYVFSNAYVGAEAAELLLTKSTLASEEERNHARDWLAIFRIMQEMKEAEISPNNTLPVFCFVAPGGFAQWDGSSLQQSGVGGSETWIIETARCIAAKKSFKVVVFCNCAENGTHDGVLYVQLSELAAFVGRNWIYCCVVSRFSEYVPALLQSPHVDNVHLILHDVRPSGNIIPVHQKLKSILCLSEWHKTLFLGMFPQFADKTRVQNYGVNLVETGVKIPASFIYSSFPNRGLSTVLQMWPRIRARWPHARLDVFCDMDNAWANTHHGPEMVLVREGLAALATSGVTNHGWVTKQVLSGYWSTAMVWLYPCRFEETFCHTALEAAAHRTLVISNGLAALAETAHASRTVQTDTAWLDDQLDAEGNLTARAIKKVEANRRWVEGMSWQEQSRKFLNHVLGFSSIRMHYINLARREDRRGFFQEQCVEQGIPKDWVCRFEAVDGSTHVLSAEEKVLFSRCDYLGFPSVRSIIGNQLSHFRIAEREAQRLADDECCVVCQDDIVFRSGFVGHLANLLSGMPADAEIVNFGMHRYAVQDIFLPWEFGNGCDSEISLQDVSPSVCRLRGTFDAIFNCTNSLGYVLTGRGARRYCAHVREHGFRMATDYDHNAYLLQRNIHYGSRTVLATSRPEFGSDIFNNIYNEGIPDHERLEYVCAIAGLARLPECELLDLGGMPSYLLAYLPGAGATRCTGVPERIRGVFCKSAQYNLIHWTTGGTNNGTSSATTSAVWSLLAPGGILAAEHGPDIEEFIMQERCVVQRGRYRVFLKKN